jgi:flagellar FliJ protein
MKRSERLERINVINAGLENLAGAKLAKISAEYSQQLNQLEQLHIYRDDYAEQLKHKMQGNLSCEALRDYRYFFASIENAIHQQESMVAHVKKKLDQCQAEWFDKRNEVEKINVAGASLKRSEALVEARREQKASDELGLRMGAGLTRLAH